MPANIIIINNYNGSICNLQQLKTKRHLYAHIFWSIGNKKWDVFYFFSWIRSPHDFLWSCSSDFKHFKHSLNEALLCLSLRTWTRTPARCCPSSSVCTAFSPEGRTSVSWWWITSCRASFACTSSSTWRAPRASAARPRKSARSPSPPLKTWTSCRTFRRDSWWTWTRTTPWWRRSRETVWWERPASHLVWCKTKTYSRCACLSGCTVRSTFSNYIIII